MVSCIMKDTKISAPSSIERHKTILTEYYKLRGKIVIVCDRYIKVPNSPSVAIQQKSMGDYLSDCISNIKRTVF